MGTDALNPEHAAGVRCPRCGNTDIVMSMPRHFWDELRRGFGFVPRHCRHCGKRFYVRVRREAGRMEG